MLLPEPARVIHCQGSGFIGPQTQNPIVVDPGAKKQQLEVGAFDFIMGASWVP